MKEIIKILEINEDEIGIIVNALTEFRNSLIREDKITEPVDDVLMKIFNAPEKRRTLRIQKLHEER